MVLQLCFLYCTPSDLPAVPSPGTPPRARHDAEREVPVGPPLLDRLHRVCRSSTLLVSHTRGSAAAILAACWWGTLLLSRACDVLAPLPCCRNPLSLWLEAAGLCLAATAASSPSTTTAAAAAATPAAAAARAAAGPVLAGSTATTRAAVPACAAGAAVATNRALHCWRELWQAAAGSSLWAQCWCLGAVSNVAAGVRRTLRVRGAAGCFLRISLSACWARECCCLACRPRLCCSSYRCSTPSSLGTVHAVC